MGSNPVTHYISQIIKRKREPHETETANIETTENVWNRRIALDFIAGWVGGCAGVLVSHPLDTVKVHLQTQDVKVPKYKGTWHCMRTLAAQEGVTALYRGITSPMSGIGLINAIVFGIYGNVQRTRKDPEALTSHALAGAVAGLFQSAVCAPIELAKTRLQLQSKVTTAPKFKGPLECLLNIIKHEGIRGTMRGVWFTVARDIPGMQNIQTNQQFAIKFVPKGFASYFVSYEYLMRQPWNTNIIYCLYAGGIAGCCSWLATYPLDVVKTCIQADDPRHPKYNGYRDCIRQSYQSNGVRFFFRGMASTMIRSFPMNAACFYVVSLIKNWAK